MKIKLLSVLVFALFFSCNNVVKPVVFDNPTNKEIVLVMDKEDTIMLNPNEKKEIPIKYGKRSISVNGDDFGKIKLEKDKDYIINPTKSNYYVKTIFFYSSDYDKRNHEKYSNDTIMIDGIEFKGEYKKYIGNLLIINDFDWSLDEPVSEIMGFTGKSKVYRLYKIYREKDLTNMLYDSFEKSLEKAKIKIEHNISLNKDSIFVIGKYIFDFPNFKLIYNDSKIILNEDEAAVLYYFATNQNSLITFNNFKMKIKGKKRRYYYSEIKSIIGRLQKYFSKDKNIKFEEKQTGRYTSYFKLNC